MKKIYQYRWLPFIAGLAALAVILTQWQALRQLELTHDNIDAVTKIGHYLSSAALAGGVFLSLFLTLAFYFARKAILRQEELYKEIEQRKQMQEALKESESRYRMLVDTMTEGLGIHDENGIVTYFNDSFCKMTGYSIDDLIGRPTLELFDDANRRILMEQMAKRKGGETQRYEIAFTKKGGDKLHAIIAPKPIYDVNGKFKGSFAVITDITDRKNLEEQLRQSQKMEAVGQLAAGIAHDFNNILSTIIGYSEFLLMKMKEGDPLRKGVTEIATAGEKGAELVRNILVFSRKEEANYIPQDLNGIIVTVKETLLRLIGEAIEMKGNLINKRLMVLADTIQMEQVLLNLATNARDAMPGGGTITISTELVRLDEEFLKSFDLCKPGEYALITFTDSGTGMDEKTREKVFEPFFTTKDVGEGTGLGLSMVYGIIKRHNGSIDLCSEAGAGTTVKIYLPIVEAACGPS